MLDWTELHLSEVQIFSKHGQQQNGDPVLTGGFDSKHFRRKKQHFLL